MISEKLKNAPLRKHGRLLVNGAVFEVKAEFLGNPVSSRGLGQTTRGDNVIVRISQYEKSVNAALSKTYGNRFCPHQRNQPHDHVRYEPNLLTHIPTPSTFAANVV